MTEPKVAIIGGGAAGFFAALSVKSHHPAAEVVIYEKTRKLLHKVKISGGGRCNVTNACTNNRQLLTAYPRGQACLKRLFKQFNTRHTLRWFETHGVSLIAEEDGRVFPATQRSQTIIDCLIQAAREQQISIRLNRGIKGMTHTASSWRLELVTNSADDTLSAVDSLVYSHVIVATGGAPKREQLAWLAQLPQTIANPVPSLFTFNLPQEGITALPGVSVEQAIIKIPGTGLSATGAALMTHWGLSGPAVLKLSAFGARWMAAQNYRFVISVNWLGIKDQARVGTILDQLIHAHPRQQVSSRHPTGIPDRLWQYLLDKMKLPKERRWAELGTKLRNQLVEQLSNDRYHIEGKTTFKEEFVTCGGINLTNVNPHTLESTTAPGIFYAGEVLDIDGITGGYNFQAAWTTGFIAGKLGQP